MAGHIFRITQDTIAGDVLYRVYKLRDPKQADDRNNREYRDGLFHTYEEAEEAKEYWEEREAEENVR